MRRFMRHPSDVPIEYELYGKLDANQKPLKNYSEGGLCFITDEWIEPDAEIHLGFPTHPSVVKAEGTVVWCKPIDGHFEVGVRFQDEGMDLAISMAE